MTTKQWLFSFYGRIGRGRWWAAVLVQLAIVMAAGLLLMPFTSFRPSPPGAPVPMQPLDEGLGALAVIVMLAATFVSFWIGLASSVKRLHDMGQSGWWLIALYLIAVVGNALVNAGAGRGAPDGAGVIVLMGVVLSIAPLIYLGAFSGQDGPNRFGADPRGHSSTVPPDQPTFTPRPDAPRQGRVESFSQELKELKKLLDDGLISQEEYDAKKKQILGI